MANVYLALKRSVVFVLLLLCQAAFAQPVINSFSPTSAWPGLPVTISGSGFSPVAGNNIVYFGPVRAAVQSASTNTLNVTVPVGATYAPITVTVNGLTAYSRLPFNVRFQNFNTTLDTNDFGPRKDVYGFSNPRSVTLADLDRDGRADLFVTNQYGNSVSVLRNTSTPQTVSFAPTKNFPGGGTGPHGSAAGDFDGDGKVDIAVANTQNGAGGSVTVYRNNSINDTIIFDTTRYATANLTLRVAIGDIDGDGKPDLLAVSNNSNIISVFRNTTAAPGAITFAPKIDLMPGAGPKDLAIADIDGDGKPDLVSIVSGVGAGVSVWRNLSTPGNISFAVRVHINTAVGATTVKVGDLNNDGKLDIVVASLNGGSMSTFRNRSTPGNISFDTRQDYTVGLPQMVSIADLNGDGRLDIAVSSDTVKTIYVYPGIESDSIKLGARVGISANIRVNDIAIGDVDGDGKVDIAFSNAELTSYAVTVLRNKQNDEAPVINSFTPTSAGTGTFVSIFGKNLSTTGSVKFGSQWADSVHVVSDSVVQARVYSGATGDVTVFTQYGVASKAGFTYIGDTTNVPDSTCPVITSFWPTSGQQSTAVYILGSNFTGSSAVRFGGVLADSIVIMSDTMIKAIVDTGATGSIQVISPSCSASKPGFTFISDSTNVPDTIPAPIIKSFNPPIGQKGTIVTIKGSFFTGATSVSFGGVYADSIVVLSDTVIQARVDSGASGTVAVTTPYGTAYNGYFTYYVMPTNMPGIISFNPTSAYRGTPVYIRGINFVGATAVRFGGVNANSFVVLYDTLIKAIVDTGASGVVSVYTPVGIGNKQGFTYLGDSSNIPDTICPVIASFWPTSGQQGTAVYILGSNFTGSSAVRFGGVLADSIVIMSDTMIKAIVDTGATGSVQVISPYCSASKPGFTYISDTTINDTLFVNARTANADGVIQKSFKLYPNPASKYVTWQQPLTNHKTRLQLVDMFGRIVRQMEVGSNTPQTTIQLHGLIAGVYKLVYIDGKNKVTSTLLIK